MLLEYLDYVLNQAAFEKHFPNGVRDQGKAGRRLQDFVNDPIAVEAGLTQAHVLALRLYSTPAFRCLNEPMRDESRRESGRPHPLPTCMAFLEDGIKMLRVIDALAPQATDCTLRPPPLWRGMRNMFVKDEFLVSGGTDFSCMSTTPSLHVAAHYALSEDCLLLKMITKNALMRGGEPFLFES